MGNLTIKQSKIHGKGVFTKTPIKANKVFYKVPLKFILNHPKAKCAFIGHNKWVCDKKILNWINHSCDANTILDISKDPVLISTRAIKEGEEITVDYNQTETGGIKVTCNCQSDKCKKYFLRIE